jgi:hypothetical protein
MGLLKEALNVLAKALPFGSHPASSKIQLTAFSPDNAVVQPAPNATAGTK